MQQNELRILIGVPGSGKSTYASQLLKEDKSFVKVSRDDFRMMLRNDWWPGEEVESLVSAMVDASIKIALNKGFNVVLDNTHCKAKILSDVIEKWGRHARIVLKVIGAELSDKQIKAQNTQRADKAVPEDVVDRMQAGLKHIVQHKKDFQEQINVLAGEAVVPVSFTQNKELPKCILVDIDGTVAHIMDRGPFEWHKVGNDNPDENVLGIVRSLGIDYHIVFMSGRDESCRQETLDWLYIYYKNEDIELYMRGEGDFRKDSIVKKELFMKHIAPKYYVQAVFDDRNQVVAMWRKELGLKCLQVEYGDF